MVMSGSIVTPACAKPYNFLLCFSIMQAQQPQSLGSGLGPPNMPRLAEQRLSVQVFEEVLAWGPDFCHVRNSQSGCLSRQGFRRAQARQLIDPAFSQTLVFICTFVPLCCPFLCAGRILDVLSPVPPPEPLRLASHPVCLLPLHLWSYLMRDKLLLEAVVLGRQNWVGRGLEVSKL